MFVYFGLRSYLLALKEKCISFLFLNLTKLAAGCLTTAINMSFQSFMMLLLMQENCFHNNGACMQNLLYNIFADFS